MTTIFDALGESWLGELMRGTPALFPSMEIVHFIGLTLLMGTILVVDLRVLGFLQAVPYAAAFELLPLTLVGFALSLISGVAFIATNPVLYGGNPALLLKFSLILLAGVNALWFTIAEFRATSALARDASASASARLMAGASLLLWTAVIVLGRLLPTFAVVGGG